MIGRIIFQLHRAFDVIARRFRSKSASVWEFDLRPANARPKSLLAYAFNQPQPYFLYVPAVILVHQAAAPVRCLDPKAELAGN